MNEHKNPGHLQGTLFSKPLVGLAITIRSAWLSDYIPGLPAPPFTDFIDELKSLRFLIDTPNSLSCQTNCDSPGICLKLGDSSAALRVGSLYILAHYLTMASEKMKGW